MNIENIVKENTALIYKISQKFYGVEKNDLFQAGALGVIKAYKNYRKNGTTKFSTYAFDYIYGEMYKLANNKEIKISKDILNLYKLIEKTRYKLAQKLNRVPNNYELSSYLEIDLEKIELASLCANNILSLDDDNDNKRELYDTIEDKKNIDTDQRILLNDSLKVLNNMERKIINKRYFEDLTQSETAKNLGITQVMVSRYEKKSLCKMQEYMML